MKRALRIFKKLAMDGSLNDKTDPDLYADFCDSEVRGTLDEFATELDFTLVCVPHTVYLVPLPDSELLAFSQRDIRESMGSNTRIIDAFLQSYILMVILWMFYGSRNSDPQRTTFLQVRDIVEALDKRFQSVGTSDQMNWQQRADIDFSQIAAAWSYRPVLEEGRRMTRTEFVLKACRLLERQRLIDFYDEQREIRPTDRLNDLMKQYYLKDSRIEEINRIFDEEGVGTDAEAQPDTNSQRGI